LVHAGDQETFGLVILEAMASGTPVVAVDAGAFREIIPETCSLLCEPNHPAAMAATVRQLFTQDIPGMKLAARRHVEAHYDWATVVTGLLGHYASVLGVTVSDHATAYAHG
jgi:alpha-1,6-mannosyltransferase